MPQLADGTIEFEVRGTPKPQPRPKAELRFAGKTRKPIVHIYTPDSYKGPDGKRRSNGVKEWRAAVARAAKHEFAAPFTGPLEVDITVYLERPKRLDSKRADPGAVLAPEAVGDSDNFAKAILDALHGVAFLNDAQVTDLTVRKRRAAAGCAPGARICVRQLDESIGLFSA